MLDRSADRDDALALDAHLARRLQPTRLDVEKVGRVQNDGMNVGLRRR
jgi:hypothetical protein